ncbi:MAG: hypothetical protein AAGB22_14210 [Bacteroidota bacterium]
MFFSVLLLALPWSVKSQVNISDSAVFSVLIDISYAYQIPGGDLNDRFGPNSNVGGAVYLKTKSNWLFGGDVSFLFGGDVEETGGLELIATQVHER